ncbi:MAG: hypothetical protein P8080_08270 [Gammaproteobacteria bacterium]
MNPRFLSRACIVAVTCLLGWSGVPPAVAQPGSEEPPARQLFWHREGDRVIVSNVRFSRTDEFTLAGRESLESTASSNAMLVLITNRRFVAYSVYTASWQSLDRKPGETVEQVVAEDWAGYVLTSRRALNFNGRTAAWSEGDR